MRLHITLDDELVRELDRRVGPRQRSGYISRAVAEALEDDYRWELLESAVGSISDTEHDWDADPGGWVREQRRADERRVG
jgi:metal-responsive CopG/Arc/MetJ family transcriptional regulator